uniref:EGF-like domain-containing protein n=1 Tax=Panagrellus redivivus TaxID=6233 RepID=A0A7E4VMT1_PANRE
MPPQFGFLKEFVMSFERKMRAKEERHPASLPQGCRKTEFECACGEPRCISDKYVGDGIAHCEDASDETEALGTDVIGCADGTASRRNPHYRGQTFEFCAQPNPCLPELGQVCLNIHGTWRCVCKLGMIRPPGPSIRCIPVSALPQSLAQRATTNCSELVQDLNLLYNSHFGSGLRVSKINDSDILRIAKDEPKVHVAEIHDEEFSSTEDVHSDVYKTIDESNDECNPLDTNACKEIYGICKKSKADDAYTCGCPSGQKLIGDKCLRMIDECSDSTLNDCDKNAICMDNDHSYECLCREGYIDTSDAPSIRPGIKCRKLVNECQSPLQNDCSQNAYCIDKPIGFTCRCNDGFIDVSVQGAKRPGRKCQKLIDECADHTAKCDKNAKCTDTDTGYRCRCPPGFIDTSPDPVNEPGRVCSLLSTGCDAKTCDPKSAECVETINGVQCQCKSGFVDRDLANPGHKCVKVKERISAAISSRPLPSFAYDSGFDRSVATGQARQLVSIAPLTQIGLPAIWEKTPSKCSHEGDGCILVVPNERGPF